MLALGTVPYDFLDFLRNKNCFEASLAYLEGVNLNKIRFTFELVCFEDFFKLKNVQFYLLC